MHGGEGRVYTLYFILSLHPLERCVKGAGKSVIRCVSSSLEVNKELG